MYRTALLALSLLGACSDTPLPSPSAADPSDPSGVTLERPYRSVLAGTATHTAVGPKSWRELNDSVAPKAGGRQ